ncbi:MAG TPA: hypothetical protein VGA05_08495 [Candidatus Bathyarchaeia archaeon]
MRYETIGGQVTKGETFQKMLYHLDELQECATVMSHLSGLNDEPLNVKGWLAVAEMIKLNRVTITKFAQKGFQ